MNCNKFTRRPSAGGCGCFESSNHCNCNFLNTYARVYLGIHE